MGIFRAERDTFVDGAPMVVAGDRRDQFDTQEQARLEQERKQAALGRLDQLWEGSGIASLVGELATDLGQRVIQSTQWPAYDALGYFCESRIPRPFRIGARQREVRRAFTHGESSEYQAVRGGLVMYRDLAKPTLESGFFTLLMEPRATPGEIKPNVLTYGELDAVTWHSAGSKLAVEKILSVDNRFSHQRWRIEAHMTTEETNPFLTGLLATGRLHQRFRSGLPAVGVLLQNKIAVDAIDEEKSSVEEAMKKFFRGNYDPTLNAGLVTKARAEAAAANQLYQLVPGRFTEVISAFEIAKAGVRLSKQEARSNTHSSEHLLPASDGALKVTANWAAWLPRLGEYPEVEDYSNKMSAARRATLEAQAAAGGEVPDDWEIEAITALHHFGREDDYYTYWEAQEHPRPTLSLTPKLFPFD
jgi:hypothetical protein